jgi:hypothetical protein
MEKILVAHIELTKEVLRALGEGVDRLNDGDTNDRDAADAVDAMLDSLGYVREGCNYISKTSCTVVAYACRQGADFGKLSPAALALVCGQADGAIGLDGFDYAELPKLSESVLTRMANKIVELYPTKKSHANLAP